MQTVNRSKRETYFFTLMPFSMAAALTLAAGILPLRCAAQQRHPQVFVGSAFGMNQMLDRSLWPYVAANADGYYNHTWGWSPPSIPNTHFPPFTAADQAKLAANFARKHVILECGMDPSQHAIPPDHTGTHSDPQAVSEMAKLGMNTDCVLLNDVLPDKAVTPTPAAFVEQWRTYCDNNYKDHASPGMLSYDMTAEWVFTSGSTLTSPGWEWLRQDILAPHSGGESFDCPAGFYAASSPTYRGPKYVQIFNSALQWVQQHGRKFVYVVSPLNDTPPAQWLRDFKQNVQGLEDSDAEPDVYGIETYCLNPAKDGPNVALTPEANPDGSPADTITGAAYYALKHRDGEPGTLTLSAAPSGGSSSVSRLTWPSPGQKSRYTLTLRNTSSWLDYAAVLRAVRPGIGKGYSMQFLVGGVDVTPEVLGSGYVFYKILRLLPSSMQKVEVILTTPQGTPTQRANPAPRMKLLLLPHSGSKALAELNIGIRPIAIHRAARTDTGEAFGTKKG